MTPSLEECETKAKETPSPHEVRSTQLDTNIVFQCLGYFFKLKKEFFQHLHISAFVGPEICFRVFRRKILPSNRKEPVHVKFGYKD